MKKILALVLALCMIFALAACGKKAEAPSSKPAASNPADAIADEMTSSDGKYTVAFVTDVGQLKDKSFNQGTYDGVKLFAADAGVSYKYYQPANGDQATDDDRYNAMKAAVDGGASVIVCAGFMQGGALERAAKDFPEVKFVFIDGWSLGLPNVVGIAFQEEQCGFLAGYAAVMEGYTRLGFCGAGGGTNPAVNRYGYGFVQGAEAAAAAKGVNVEMNYTFLYGASFQASPELQTLVSGWYENGTEVVFSCGGSIFSSITAAASANGGKVIGVDIDQSSQSDTVITSALKEFGAAAGFAIDAAMNGRWEALTGGSGFATFGAAEGAVGLPVATWSLRNWSVGEYESVLNDIAVGRLAVDMDFDNLASTAHVSLNVVE